MLELVFCEFWFDYVKPKYGEKEKLCDIITDSFTLYTKIHDFCKGIKRLEKEMLRKDLLLQIMN